MKIHHFLLGVMISLLVVLVCMDAPRMEGDTLAINVLWFWEIALLVVVSVVFLKERNA